MQHIAVSIEQCELFHDLPYATVERVKELVSERRFGAGETIFREGDAAEEIFILASGQVELTYTLPNHADVSLPITAVSPGELFGWSAAAGAKNLTAKAHTATESTIYVISAGRFDELCYSEPATGYVLMRRLLKLARARLHGTRSQLRWMQSYS